MRAARVAILLLAAWTFCAAPPAPGAQRRHRRKKPAKTKPAPANFDARLPVLGTKLAAFPDGPGRTSAERGCVFCHSADMVVQQHLTEKQWAAEVTKMTNWGADVPADKKDELVAYLVKNFGPDASPREPIVTRPVGR